MVPSLKLLLALMLAAAAPAYAGLPPVPGMVRMSRGAAVAALRAMGIQVYYFSAAVDYRLPDLRNSRIRATPTTAREARRLAYLLANELSLYPVECLRRMRLSEIVIGSRLKLNEVDVAGAPEFTNGLLIYATSLVDRPTYGSPAAYAIDVIHHEFYHLWDYRDDGQLLRDSAWEALNPANFNAGRGYGHGGEYVRDETAGNWEIFSGALSRYAMASVEEDKAVTYSGFLHRPEDMLTRISSDSVIRAKAQLLKRQMVNYCSSLNQTFFDNARATFAARLAVAERLVRGETLSGAPPLAPAPAVETPRPTEAPSPPPVVQVPPPAQQDQSEAPEAPAAVETPPPAAQDKPPVQAPATQAPAPSTQAPATQAPATQSPPEVNEPEAPIQIAPPTPVEPLPDTQVPPLAPLPDTRPPVISPDYVPGIDEPIVTNPGRTQPPAPPAVNQQPQPAPESPRTEPPRQQRNWVWDGVRGFWRWITTPFRQPPRQQPPRERRTPGPRHGHGKP